MKCSNSSGTSVGVAALSPEEGRFNVKTFFAVAGLACVLLFAIFGGLGFIVGGIGAVIGYFFYPRWRLLYMARQFGVPFARAGVFNLKTVELHRGPDYDVMVPLAQAQATLDELIDILLEDRFLVEGGRVTFVFSGQRKIVNPYTEVILVGKLYDVDEKYLILRRQKKEREIWGA